MKKVLVITLAFIYSLMAVGLTVSLHFCGTSIAAINLGVTEDGCCCKTKKKCCDTTVISTKITDNHQPASFDAKFKALAILPIQHIVCTHLVCAYTAPKTIYTQTKPPPNKGSAMLCVWRI